MDARGAEPCEVLDLRGQICPATLLKSLQKINGMRDRLKSGAARLAIFTDNRDSTDTVSDAAMSMGYRVTVSREDAHYRIGVERGD